MTAYMTENRNLKSVYYVFSGLISQIMSKIFENDLAINNFMWYTIECDFMLKCDFPLSQWLYDVRKRKSKLPDEDIRYLDSMQFVWESGKR